MLVYAVGVLGAAAVGGAVLASAALQGREVSWPLSIGHALLGAAGLVLVLLGALAGQGGTLAWAALGVLVVAALGGFFLASLHLKGETAPKPVVLVHAVVAVAGFATLAAAAFL